MPRFADYMRLVKFQHTIFAMPFALMAFAYAMWKYALAEDRWYCARLLIQQNYYAHVFPDWEKPDIG